MRIEPSKGLLVEEPLYGNGKHTETVRELDLSEDEPNLATEDTCFKAPLGNLDSILRY